MQYQLYDFAAAARVERPLWLGFNGWMQKSSELFVEHWSDLSPTSVNVHPRTIDARAFASIQKEWDTPCCGMSISFHGEATTGMLVIERKQLFLLLMDILMSTDDEIEDRALTSVETSLAKLIFEQVASCFGQGWPKQETLEYELGEIDFQPSRSRMFAPESELLMSGLSVHLGEDSADIQLYLAKEKTQTVLGVEKINAQSNTNSGRRLSEEQIGTIEIDICAEFGKAEVAMEELVSIVVGDIVILDQPVDAPLVVFAQ